jgi:hypothetical protein
VQLEPLLRRERLVMFRLCLLNFRIGLFVEPADHIERSLVVRTLRVVRTSVEQQRQICGLEARKIVVESIEPVVCIEIVDERTHAVVSVTCDATIRDEVRSSAVAHR